MLKLLVTNDDGIDAVGLTVLVEKLADHAEVYVVAPADQQSAKSQSITFLRNVSVDKVSLPGARAAYVIDGTPADCVKWAIPEFRERGLEFDYLFSGINLGANVGIAAYYSGTIAAAREGALNGVRSIALSVHTHEATQFDYICNLIPRLMEMSDSLNVSTILSVNAPNIPMWEVKGVRIAEVAPWGYVEEYAFSKVAEGVYRMGQRDFVKEKKYSAPSYAGNGPKAETGLREIPDSELKYDLDCMRRGYVAITPLITHTSDDAALRKLQGLFAEDDMAAVIVDAQESLVERVMSPERVRENLIKLAKCVGRLDMPSVAAELYDKGPMIQDVADALNIGGRSQRLLRREFSVWGNGDFGKMMAGTSARKVLIAGVETHGAVMQTALDFVSKGYEVTVVEDCCSSVSGHDHKVAIDEMRHSGCRVMTLGAVMTERLFAENHPAAGYIKKILG